MSVYIQLLTILNVSLPSVSFLAYGIGLYAFGPFVNKLVQLHQRKHVCMAACVSLVLLILVYWQILVFLPKWTVVVMAFLLGAFFGQAQMILMSTLVIDISESFMRTEANYAANWFSRLALALGPILFYTNLFNLSHYQHYFWYSIGCGIAALVLLSVVRIPFKAPDEGVTTVSLDRFFLPSGKWLFANLVLVTAIIGLLFTLPLSVLFFVMLLLGFIVAVIAEKFVFADADLKSEAITGLILIGMALLMMTGSTLPVVEYVAPAFIGLGTGIIGSRFLLFFIKLSRHCQRGTSQSTFFLAWESGIAVGMFFGCRLMGADTGTPMLYCCLALTVISLLFYNFFVHSWYVNNKNR